MAGDALKFQVNLAGNLVQELVAGGKAANTAEGSIQALTGAILAMTESSKPKDKDFFVFDLAKGAEMAIGLVKSLAGAMFDLGREIIGVAAEAQDLNLAVRLTAGPANVDAVNALADSFGDTRFDDDEIKKLVLPLLDVGVGKNDPGILLDIVTAATDIAARYNDPAKTKETVDAFSRIAIKREVSAKMLMGLGINEADFYKSLGETLGKSSKIGSGESKTKSAIEEYVAAGKVNSETLIAEVLGQIAQREGGSLGIATDESVKTLGTTLARLENLPGNILKKFADSEAVKAVQTVIDDFIAFASGPKGEAIVNELIVAFGRLAEQAGPFLENLPGYIEDSVLVLRTFGAVAGFVTDVFVVTGEAIGTVVGMVYVLGEDIYNFFAVTIPRIYNSATDIGAAIIKGIVDGVTAGVVAVKDAVSNLGGAIVTEIKDVLGIHSPSSVMHSLMVDGVGAGAVGGLDESGPRVQQAARRNLSDSVVGSAPSPLSAGAAGLMGFGDITVINNFNGVAGSPEQIGEAAGSSTRAELAKFLDEARSRFGARAA